MSFDAAHFTALGAPASLLVTEAGRGGEIVMVAGWPADTTAKGSHS